MQAGKFFVLVGAMAASSVVSGAIRAVYAVSTMADTLIGKPLPIVDATITATSFN